MDKQLIRHALAYYKDFVAPQQKRRPPTPTEATALKDLADSLAELPLIARRKPFKTLCMRSANATTSRLYAIGFRLAMKFSSGKPRARVLARFFTFTDAKKA